MPMRRSLLYTVLLGSFMLFGLAACSGGGNPNMSAARSSLEDGNLDQALASVNTAIEQDSAGTNAQARLLKSEILRGMADSTTPPDRYRDLYARAQEAEQEAFDINPALRSEAKGTTDLGFVQQMREGVEAFNAANQSGDSTTFMRAAAYFGAAGTLRPDSADSHLNEAYALLNAGAQEEAIEPLEMYTSKADTVDANSFRILGQLYLTNDRANEGVDLLETAIEEYPEDEDLQSLLLNAYNQTGQTDRAMELYASQVERDPDNATYRYNYGTLLLSRDQFQEAQQQLQRAVEIDPDNIKALYNLGATHVNLAGALNDSIGTMEENIRESDSEMTDEQESTISSLVRQRQEQFVKAIEPLEKARELSGPNNEYRQDVCRALFTSYVNTEQQDKAEQVETCAGYTDGGPGSDNSEG